MRRHILILVLTLTQATFGQDYKGEIPIVPADGFYAVQINAAMHAQMNANFSDVRLLDRDQKEVPFLAFRSEWSIESTVFQEFAILSRTQYKKSSELIFENPNYRQIQSICLKIQNAAVNKTFRLIGSNDRQTWYTLLDQYNFTGADNAAGTSEIKMVNFPLSDYPYFKLEMDDSLSPPIQVLAVGNYLTQSNSADYEEWIPSKITNSQALKQRKTIVQIVFPDEVLIDRFSFQVSGEKYYQRNAFLVTDSTNWRERSYSYDSHGFHLSSNGTNTVDFGSIVSDTFYLLIDNQDNPPLSVVGAKGFHQRTVLKAYLKSGMNYSLVYGNPAAKMPEYDLGFFESEIPAEIPTLTVQNIQKSEHVVLEEWVPEKKDRTLLWVAIGLLIAFLIYMSNRMLKDMKK